MVQIRRAPKSPNRRMCPQLALIDACFVATFRGTAEPAPYRPSGIEAMAATQELPICVLLPHMYGVTNRAACVAERLGEGALAEQFAERTLQVAGANKMCQSQMHALLGRMAAGRGDRSAAVTRWREVRTDVENTSRSKRAAALSSRH